MMYENNGRLGICERDNQARKEVHPGAGLKPIQDDRDGKI